MSYQAIVNSNSRVSDLDDELNDALGAFPGATLVAVDLTWGDSKNRAALLIETSSSSDSTTLLKTQAFVESTSLSDLESAVNSWVAGGPGTILGLALKYSNDQWKALVVYSDAKTSVDYEVKSELETTWSEEQDDITADLAGARDVAAFGFAYHDAYAALYIYTP